MNQMLHVVYATPTAEELKQKLEMYERYWIHKFPPYSIYFHEQWVVRIPVSDWAYCCRATQISGDHSMEGWHNRIKTTDFKKQKTIGFALSILWNEDDYWQKIMNNTELRNRHIKEVEDRRKKYEKRTTLKDWVGYTANKVHIYAQTVNEI